MQLFDRKRYAAAPVLLALCLVGVAPSARAALVLDLNPGGSQSSCTDCGTAGSTLGWGFTVTGSFSVNGIGVWDSFSNGIGLTVPAGLWRSDGTLLASVSISDSSTPVASANGDGQWLFADIPQLTLTPGDYLIGSVFYPSGPTFNLVSFNTIPEITGVVPRSSTFPDGGFQAPVNSFVRAIFGPTLRLVATPPAAVPEPATTVALFTLGAIGLVGRRFGARK